jgi:hypothetical protein
VPRICYAIDINYHGEIAGTCDGLPGLLAIRSTAAITRRGQRAGRERRPVRNDLANSSHSTVARSASAGRHADHRAAVVDVALGFGRRPRVVRYEPLCAIVAHRYRSPSPLSSFLWAVNNRGEALG